MRSALPAALCVLLFAARPAPADWPLARGNPLMTGVAPPAPGALPDQLATRWTFECKDAVEGAPIVVGGVAYVGSFDKHFYALDVATGQLKWKKKLAPIKASAGAKGDRVYVGDMDGKFYCLDRATGDVVWTFETGGEITAGCNFHGDNVLIGSHDSTLYCLGPDGKKRWDVKTEGPVNGSPVVVGDTTFLAGCDEVLHVVDARTGKELGTVPLGGQAAATASVVGDKVYVGTMTNQVVGVDWKQLKRDWAFDSPRNQPFYASAAVAGGLVVAGGRDKRVYGLDRLTGKEVWAFPAADRVEGAPAVAGDRVYVGSVADDGNFYVLDLKTGKKLQELKLDGPVTGSVAVGPGCVLVGTDRGTVYCLGTK